MSITTEINIEAEIITIERVTGAADPASAGAGAGAGENSAYSRATAAVEETSRTKRTTIATWSAPPEAIVQMPDVDRRFVRVKRRR
ncbi:hypothetical protein E3N88_14851 [Mikania micrantha]|uniref:Uncharacterized protein n=1 Tax=Mikania micrantha TaxID=192012 RepID=A0A5N6P4B9_9ASTR|nr:hypothetical protein E3N88_14851 [Mikania micrantha]